MELLVAVPDKVDVVIEFVVDFNIKHKNPFDDDRSLNVVDIHLLRLPGHLKLDLEKFTKLPKDFLLSTFGWGEGGGAN